MSAIEILAVIGIIGYVIYQQVKGQPLRGKRTVLLPAILTAIGFMNLRSGGVHPTGDDIACLVAGTAGSAAIGLAFGAVTRLESRDGYLWAQLPLRGLWLWAALVAWRVVVILLATGLHANVAASSATLLLSLGVNRLGQAAVITARAMGMGVPFAPEKNGRVFMAGTPSGSGDSRPGGQFSGHDNGYDDLDQGYGSGVRTSTAGHPHRTHQHSRHQRWDRS